MAPESAETRLARFEERLDAVRSRVDRLDRDVVALGPIAGQVIELVAEFRSMAEDFSEVQRDMREDRKERTGMSLALKLALIGGSFALAAAIIAAIAQIVSGG